MKIIVNVIGSEGRGQRFFLSPAGKDPVWLEASKFDAAPVKQLACAGGIPCLVEVVIPDDLAIGLGWAAKPAGEKPAAVKPPPVVVKPPPAVKTPPAVAEKPAPIAQKPAPIVEAVKPAKDKPKAKKMPTVIKRGRR